MFRKLLVVVGVSALLIGCPPKSSDKKKKNNKVEVLVTKLANPWGMAFRSNGDLLFVTHEDHLVQEVVNLGQPTQTVNTCPNKVFTPTAVGLSTDGNYVVPCYAPNVTDLLDQADPTGTNIDSNGPGDALIEDPTGCIAAGADTDAFYLVNSMQGSIVELQYNGLADPADNTVMTVAAGAIIYVPNVPTHLVYLSGMIYAADTGGDRVVSVDPTVGLPSTVADSTAGLNQPAGLALTLAGNLLVGNFGDGDIIEITTAGSVVRTIPTGVGKNKLRGVAVDATDQIYIAYGTLGKRNGKIARVLP